MQVSSALELIEFPSGLTDPPPILADSEEDSQNDANSAALSTWSAQSSSISCIFKTPLLESFTTDGKGEFATQSPCLFSLSPAYQVIGRVHRKKKVVI